MHDWLFIGMNATWENGSIELKLNNPSSQLVSIHAINFFNFEASRKMELGESNSINSHELISCGDSTWHILSIEMQSGDVIRIEAERFALPDGITT